MRELSMLEVESVVGGNVVKWVVTTVAQGAAWDAMKEAGAAAGEAMARAIQEAQVAAMNAAFRSASGHR